MFDPRNLTGNTLSTIPDAIYNMSTLKELYMNDCNLTNLVLSTDQFNFLESLTNFQADITFTGSCPENYTTTENRNQDKVCIPGTATDATTINTKSSHTVAIAVGVAGGVLVLCIIAFLIYRSRKSRETTDKNWVTMTDPTFTGGEDDISTFGSTIWNDPELLAVRVEHTSVELIKLLSRGGFGEVWLGMYMNENVAVKRLLPDKRSPSDALAFASEIKIMARLDHPKIVRFIAVSWMNAVTIQAVTEFMDCGDLKSLLDSNRAEQLTWANLKCQIAIDIADALVYLHTLNPKLIHRDLKSRNVLIDAETGAKLSDFGISRNRSVEETMTAGVGTSRWIAPEVIVGGHYTEFADIYSFGVVLSELDTCKAPFHDAANTNGGKMPDVTILQLVSAGKLQPTFEASCPASIVKLARACLSFDPAQRPSAIHISFELRKIMKEEL